MAVHVEPRAGDADARRVAEDVEGGVILMRHREEGFSRFQHDLALTPGEPRRYAAGRVQSDLGAVWQGDRAALADLGLVDHGLLAPEEDAAQGHAGGQGSARDPGAAVHDTACRRPAVVRNEIGGFHLAQRVPDRLDLARPGVRGAPALLFAQAFSHEGLGFGVTHRGAKWNYCSNHPQSLSLCRQRASASASRRWVVRSGMRWRSAISTRVRPSTRCIISTIR